MGRGRRGDGEREERRCGEEGQNEMGRGRREGKMRRGETEEIGREERRWGEGEEQKRDGERNKEGEGERGNTPSPAL